MNFVIFENKKFDVYIYQPNNGKLIGNNFFKSRGSLVALYLLVYRYIYLSVFSINLLGAPWPSILSIHLLSRRLQRPLSITIGTAVHMIDVTSSTLAQNRTQPSSISITTVRLPDKISIGIRVDYGTPIGAIRIPLPPSSKRGKLKINI